MSDILYFKSATFSSNKEFAVFLFDELNKAGFSPEHPEDQDYMFVIKGYSGEQVINFYLGRNDEDSSPPLWQVWPEQQLSFFKKIFGNVDKAPELLVREKLESIVRNIEDATGIEWDI